MHVRLDHWLHFLVRRALAIACACSVAAGLLFAPSARAQSPPDQIVELARALKNDPDLIYEYVYNNVRTLPMAGSVKGALGALLDGEGTGTDQAELMVTLLRQAGYNANYAIGSIHLSGTQLSAWLGTDASYSALQFLFVNGGFQNYGFATNSDLVTDGHFDWVWVQVTIGGNDYLFDPGTKCEPTALCSASTSPMNYNRTAGLGTTALLSAMGYNRSTFLSDAAAVTTTSPWSLTSLNRTALRNDLATYAGNLVKYIRSNNPAAAPSDIIGGTSIVPLPLGLHQRVSASDYLPYQFSPTHTVSSTIPSGYRATLTQQLGYMSGSTFVSLSPSVTFNTADIYGHRMTLAFSSAAVASLLLDGVAQISASGSVPGGAHLVVQATLNYNYPYSSTSNPFPGFTNDTHTNVPSAANAVYALVLGLGSVSRGMIESRRRQLQQNIALYPGNPTTEPVLGESLMIVAYTYMTECAYFMQLAAQLSGTVLQNFNYYGTFSVATFGGVTGPQISIWGKARSCPGWWCRRPMIGPPERPPRVRRWRAGQRPAR